MRNKDVKYAVIIGAGPAGLTAAYELLTRTNIVPIVLEKSGSIGGLSRTVNYKGNRIDVGGHRFFSKSFRVIDWWLKILPLQSTQSQTIYLGYRGQSAVLNSRQDSAGQDSADKIMLIRNRKSRIYFQGKLFSYPVAITSSTLKKLGLLKSIRIGLSYIRSRLFPIPDETNLEQFFVNRFGRELYLTFFKSYTEKVWGSTCKDISADWGAQRIRGLSLTRMVKHNLRHFLLGRRRFGLSQHNVETSLIEQFLYPKLGPGQMWEEVARLIRGMGGQILTDWNVDRLDTSYSRRVTAIFATSSESGTSKRFDADYVFSTMPVNELVPAMNPPAPDNVRRIAAGLRYREFITVGLLCKRLALRNFSEELLQDNWIYIQEPSILAGRLQIFNNWSPAMVADPSTLWVGLEYFCDEADRLWHKEDHEMAQLAQRELLAMGMLNPSDIIDSTVVRAPKAYPAYWGTYDRFSEIVSWSDRFENLFLIGRNGMHKYNNQDHSMLTAMVAVDNIVGGISTRANLWALNTEQQYQEERSPVPNVA